MYSKCHREIQEDTEYFGSNWEYFILRTKRNGQTFMILSISITLSILLSYFFIYLEKKLSLLQNIIIYMVTVFISKNYLTIMNMELKLIKITEDHLMFITFLIFREIITPLLVLIFINAFLLTSLWRKKALVFIGVISTMQGITYFFEQFKVFEFVKWNYIYALMVNSAYLLIGLGLTKVLLIVQKRKW
jgi:hypothetical protein